MPNIATLLKEEIRRLARKEARAATSALKKRLSVLSKTTVQQKREIVSLQKELSRLRKSVMADRPAPIAAAEAEVKKARIGPRSIKAQRKRLKLTQAQYARLVHVSPPTILAWEKGTAAPRGENIATLVGVRKITRTEARRRLGLPPAKRKAVSGKRKKRKGRRKAKKAK